MGASFSTVGPAVQQRLGIGSRIGWRVSWPRRFVARSLVREFEAEQRRWFLWLPVLLGTGIATFFALHDPPPLWIAAAGAIAAAAALVVAGSVWRSHGTIGAVLLGIAVLAAGILYRKPGPLTPEYAERVWGDLPLPGEEKADSDAAAPA